MYTILLVSHIVAMTVSIALMSSAFALGILGKESAVRAASYGMIATAFGAVSGSILLFFAPILSECLFLTAYLAAVTTIYVFGFGNGTIENARFIRHSASIQKR